MKISIVILAAGFGTRMKSSLPKVLHKISGYPMIYHIIEQSKKLSDDIHIIVYHQKTKVIEEVKKEFSDIIFHTQNIDKYSGTGGALMGVEFAYDRVLVLCGDMPLLTCEDLKPFLQTNSEVILGVFKAKNPNGYGRIIEQNGQVKAIVEQKDASEEQKNIDIVNAGVYVFDKDFLQNTLPKLDCKNAQNEYYLTDLIKIANEENKSVKSIVVNEQNFMGINSKSQLALAEEFMQDKIRQKFMNDGVLMRLPKTIYIDAKAKIEGECVIENGVSIQGKCLIENSHIKANSVIEDSEIKNSDIGPMARIRPQSKIINTHIGNFVEIKKSILNGVKAGHLSYLGDSEIGQGTNVGCGTITCNYDGVKKHKTIIGQNVFIGSDTQLIAPVKIEDDVLIAAGTCVNKDVKKGSLAINRSPLKIIENFYYKFFKKD